MLEALLELLKKSMESKDWSNRSNDLLFVVNGMHMEV